MLERIAEIQKDALTEVVAPKLADENDILRARLAAKGRPFIKGPSGRTI